MAVILEELKQKNLTNQVASIPELLGQIFNNALCFFFVFAFCFPCFLDGTNDSLAQLFTNTGNPDSYCIWRVNHHDFMALHSMWGIFLKG